ncbi:hypothetical protein FZC78_11380 [Rossellomorea vietnamensis]|uniref:Uncharacterized protein n=1 Tax=Rossellomorea vietnamensis TaxID=218284 RepID=A0A5D4NT07_9BACI|nr:hypothetical protein [Rossellomorea vietnamensis]TYS16588.1 hypothetical protein FZC78_11380 [Rossellomorea vietnamensis]
MDDFYSTLLETAGGWIQAAGAAIVSVGGTILASTSEESSVEKGLKLVAIGNGIEAAGNSLQAIGREKAAVEKRMNLTIFGAWLQAAGNVTNVAAALLILDEEEESGFKLDVLGDSVQFLGALSETVGLRSSEESPFLKTLVSGNLIQSFGLLIEAIGALYIVKGQMKLGERIKAIGNYIQTAGVTVAAIGLTEKLESEE